MDLQWVIILTVILVIVITFGSMRQNRIKQVMLGSFEMVGGKNAKPSRHVQSEKQGVNIRRSQKYHPRYVGRPTGYYYGDPYDYGDGYSYDWRPYWLKWNYWWPETYSCVDYATEQCAGSADYQTCFNVEYRNCPYAY